MTKHWTPLPIFSAPALGDFGEKPNPPKPAPPPPKITKRVAGPLRPGGKLARIKPADIRR